MEVDPKGSAANAGKPPPDSTTTGDTVTRDVTMIILIAYIILVVISFVVASMPGANQQGWFDLTKTGFATLGSALTLILGYYFGQKQVTQEVKQESQKTIQKIKAEAEESKNALVGLLKTMPAQSEPESFEAVDKNNLPTRRPRKSTPDGQPD